MGYNSEKQFEDDLVKMLFEQKGWKDGILGTYQKLGGYTV